MKSIIVMMIFVAGQFAFSAEPCTKGTKKVIANETKACEKGFIDQAKANQRKVTDDVKDYVVKICACSIQALYADGKCVVKADVPNLSRTALTKCVAEVPPPKVMQK